MKRAGITMARGPLLLTLALTLALAGSIGVLPRSAQALTERHGPLARSEVRTASDLVVVASQPLTTGCNQVTETGLQVGGKVSDWIAQNVQPSASVIAVWHYDNPSQAYKAAYFNVAAVPVDVPTFQTAVDAFFICVSGSATAP